MVPHGTSFTRGERKHRTTRVCTCCAPPSAWMWAENLLRTSSKLTFSSILFALYFQKPQTMDQVNVTRKSAFFFLFSLDRVWFTWGGFLNSCWTLRQAAFALNECLFSTWMELRIFSTTTTGEFAAVRWLCFSLPAISSGVRGVGRAPSQQEKVKGRDETYWREINAAMALTNLAQSKDSVPGTTSCIIQKSSHIAEIKTVKVPLVQKY